MSLAIKVSSTSGFRIEAVWPSRVLAVRGPAEVRPSEVRPAEVRPAEVRPGEVRPAEVGRGQIERWRRVLLDRLRTSSAFADDLAARHGRQYPALAKGHPLRWTRQTQGGGSQRITRHLADRRVGSCKENRNFPTGPPSQAISGRLRRLPPSGGR
jgi:hypothetical protein